MLGTSWKPHEENRTGTIIDVKQALPTLAWAFGINQLAIGAFCETL